MNITAISLQKNNSVVAQKIKAPNGQQENFQTMLAQAIQHPAASTAVTATKGAEESMNLQQINELLNEKKKKISRLEQDLINEESAPVDETDAPEKPNGTAKNFLKGILEESGGPKYKEDTTPKQYQGPISRTIGKSNDLIAQLPTARQNAPVRNFQRRIPTAATQPAGGAAPQLAIAPFQVFLDKAVDFFQMVSDQENSSDTLMQDFVLGKATLEEVTLAKAKVGVAVTYAMTIANQITQTFKEILNMQV